MGTAFFLKINRDTDYTMYCIDYWQSVVRELGASCWIICDNELLSQKLIQTEKIAKECIIPSLS